MAAKKKRKGEQNMRKRKLRVVASALSLGLILSGMGSIPAKALVEYDPTYPLNDPSKDYEKVWWDEFDGERTGSYYCSGSRNSEQWGSGDAEESHFKTRT